MRLRPFMLTSISRLAAILTLLLLSFAAFAQEPPRHAAYGEVFGNGILPTVNYELRFTNHWAGRIGLGAVFTSESDGDSEATFAIPIMANYISHPERSHHFEAGGGVLFVTGDAQDFWLGDDDEEIANVALTGVAGYRYQRPGRGFIFRAGVTPFYFDGEVAPFAGVSFGYGW